MKCFDFHFLAEIDIKLHELLADSYPPVLRMNTDIEQFGLLPKVPKTYKTHHPTLRNSMPLNGKTVGEGAFDLIEKHFL